MTLAEWEHFYPEEVKEYREYMRLREDLMPRKKRRSGQLTLPSFTELLDDKYVGVQG
jgi:hypothetical protein